MHNTQVSALALAVLLATLLAPLSACRSESRAKDADVSIRPAAAAADPVDAHEAAGSESAVALDTHSAPDAIMREEREVQVDGVAEKWRLEWRHPPVPVCVDEAWATCPCAGFAFGERGELDLVRARPGVAEERLHLSPLFDDGDARLPRWPVQARDRMGTPRPEPSSLQKRPLVEIMKLGDYDHDGRATEFVLQVAAYTCGHSPAVVVGIDRVRGLHAFTSVEQPKEPLTLESGADWERVRRSLPLDLVAVPCGDHGADDEVRLSVSRDDAGALHAAESKRPCSR